MAEKLTTLQQLRRAAERSKSLAGEVASAAAEAIGELAQSKQDALTGTKGQVVGFDAEGKPAAQEAPESGMTEAQADERYLKLSGGTMTGYLKMNGQAIGLVDSITFKEYMHAIDYPNTYSGLGLYCTTAFVGGRYEVTIKGLKFTNYGKTGSFYTAIPTEDDQAANKQYVDKRLPSGVIVMWSGSAVPDGWTLCTGQNGTPDLRGRFVLGTSDAHKLGETGGEETVTLTVRQMPKHDHKLLSAGEGETYDPQYATTTKMAYTAFAKSNIIPGGGYFPGQNEPNYYPNVSYMDDTGHSEAHPNMPPYYALAYIMKL